MLLRVYVPLARPIYVAYALVSVSYHWNNFLWPLIVTNSVEARPLTVGLQVFSSGDQGIDWAIICAATLMTSGPLWSVPAVQRSVQSSCGRSSGRAARLGGRLAQRAYALPALRSPLKPCLLLPRFRRAPRPERQYRVVKCLGLCTGSAHRVAVAY